MKFDADSPEVSREDQLLHRAIEGTAGPADWAEIELLGRRDPGVWKRLALGMRGELQLRQAGLFLEDSLPTLPTSHRAPPRRDSLLIGGLGWAAAFLIAITWWGSRDLLDSSSPDENKSSLGASSAWTQYLAAGEDQVQELEPLVLSAVPTAAGDAIELTFVRRAVERTVLREVHELRVDDAGTTSSERIPAAQLVSNEL